MAALGEAVGGAIIKVVQDRLAPTLQGIAPFYSLSVGHDVREVQPYVSERFRTALTEDHADQKDASGLAFLALWKRDLPPVRLSADDSHLM